METLDEPIAGTCCSNRPETVALAACDGPARLGPVLNRAFGEPQLDAVPPELLIMLDRLSHPASVKGRR